MKYYLFSEQDLDEVYWIIELLLETLKEKAEQREIEEEND